MCGYWQPSKQAVGRINLLLKRLDLPSRKEVEELSRRLAQLEKHVHGKRRAFAEAAPAPAVLETPAMSND